MNRRTGKIIAGVAILSVVGGIVYMTNTGCVNPNFEQQVQDAIEFGLNNPEYVVGSGITDYGTELEEYATEEQWEQMVANGWVSNEVAAAHSNKNTSAATLNESTTATTQTTPSKNDAQTAATNSTTKTEEAEDVEEETVVEITVDESVKGTYIATNNASIIKDYETKDAAGNLDVAKEYEVTGITSNGYYVVKYKNIEGYVSASDVLLITKEQYDAAWKEAVVNEPSCTEDGSVTYFNTYTEETNIVVDKPALGHQGDWQTVFAPGLFKDGKSENICSVCGELLDERVDNAPLSIFHILLFCILIAFIIVIFLKINNKRNVNKANLAME